MANEKRLKLIDYNEIRMLFDEEYKKTAQLICDGETHLDNLAEGFTEADKVIWKLPTVDAVEVVRCKDCFHYVQMPGSVVDYRCSIFCGCYERPYPMEADGFCSYGERREGE